MSNPDFPGPSWQDRPGYPDEPPQRRGGGYENGYSGGQHNGWGSGQDDYPGGRDNYAGGSNGYQGERDGYRGGRDDYAGGRDGYQGRRRGGDQYGGESGYDAYGGPGREATGVAGGGFEDIGRGHGNGYRDSRGGSGVRTAVRRGARGDFGGPRGPRRPGGPGGRRPGQAGGQRWPWEAGWWRHWTWRKAGLLTGGVAAGTALAMILGFFALYMTVSVPMDKLSAAIDQSSVVYFADGKTEVGAFSSSTGTQNVLTEDQVRQSKNLYEAVMAAEDRSFFTEGGISISGLLRAMKSTLTGGGIQGGSTITEQLVKTVYEHNFNLTYKQKISEIIVAIKLAKMKDKWWILTHYLNDIYLGSGANGAGAAAQIYFGVPASQLTVPQAAMIAAMIQAPGAFDPYNPHAVVSYLGYSLYDRWHNEVLPNLVRDGVITQQQMDTMRFPRVLSPSKTASSSWAGYRGYIMMAVQNELANPNLYGTKYDTLAKVEAAGLQVVTTFSKTKMDALYAAVSDMKSYMGGPKAFPSWAHIGAILEDPKTGAILAMYGGPNWIKNQYNMATQARNQVGSSFKPYVLATAVQQGMNVQTSKLNGTSPLCVPPDSSAVLRTMLSTPKTGSCPPMWATVTPDGATKSGPVTVAAATAASSNPAYVDLAHFVGTRNVVKMAEQFGVNPAPYPNGSNLSNLIGQTGIALGIAALTVQEQASTFATLANGGIYHQPHVIKQLTLSGQPIVANLGSHQVLNPAQAADVDYALSFDTNSASGYPGTGTNAILSPYRPTIAKTGTTDNYHSAFFLGALPEQYSFAVGMFTDSLTNAAETLSVLPSTGGWTGGYGGAWPATLWRLYLTRVLAIDNPVTNPLPTPDVTGFQTWIRAQPLPNKSKKCQPGTTGGGPGNHHGHGKGGQQQCQNPGPSGSPTPSSSVSISPGPTPTITSPTPGPTITFTPPGAPPLGIGQLGSGKPAAPATLSAFWTRPLVTLTPRGSVRRPASLVTTTALA